MKRKIIYKFALVVMVLATLSSCKKDEETSPGGGSNSGPIPTSLVGSWEISGQDLPKQSFRDKYEKWTFDVTANDAYSLKYFDKNGDVTDFAGKVVVWDSDEKHTNGVLIRFININVETINGQSFPGGWKGIYAFEAGNILKLNIEPNVSGVFGPTPRDGFGSGDSGAEGIYHFKKK
ncbi:MAG: hypothetical protein ACN6I4_00755 [bacterium]